MSTIRIVVGMLSVGLMILGAGRVSSQAYPNKPIRILAGSVGSNADTTARLAAQGISGPLGQPVIVENRPGNILPELVAKAPPDGYLIFITGGSVWIRPFLQNTNYAVSDLAPITVATTSPDILVVHPSLPVKSVKELIALAKARPGELNYASGPTGSSQHMEGELLKSLAGVDIVRIIYQGTEAQIRALVIGEVQLAFVGAVGVAPYLKSGKLKALAVGSPKPSAMSPGLPTIAASLPGFEPVSELAMFAPAKTPAEIISRLNQEIVRVLNQADVKAKLLNLGVEVVGSSPEQAAAKIKDDMARMGKLIKDAGIKGN